MLKQTRSNVLRALKLERVCMSLISLNTFDIDAVVEPEHEV